MQDIQGFTVRDCRQFYRTHYCAANATVVIAGDFDERKALRLVQKHYGSLPRAKAPPAAELPREPTQRAERVLTLEAPTPTEKLLLGYRAPEFSHQDTAALVLTSELLFGGRSSRLHRAFCIEREIALSVRGSLSPFVDPGLFDIWIFVRHGCRRQEALALLDEELINAHRQRGLSPSHPVLRGSSQNPDVFFQARESVKITETMDAIQQITAKTAQGSTRASSSIGAAASSL